MLVQLIAESLSSWLRQHHLSSMVLKEQTTSPCVTIVRDRWSALIMIRDGIVLVGEPQVMYQLGEGLIVLPWFLQGTHTTTFELANPSCLEEILREVRNVIQLQEQTERLFLDRASRG